MGSITEKNTNSNEASSSLSSALASKTPFPVPSQVSRLFILYQEDTNSNEARHITRLEKVRTELFQIVIARKTPFPIPQTPLPMKNRPKARSFVGIVMLPAECPKNLTVLTISSRLNRTHNNISLMLTEASPSLQSGQLPK